VTAPVTDREADRFAELAGLDRRTVAQLLALWALLDLNDMQGSFEADVLPDAATVMVEAQAEAAQIGSDYVDDTAAALGARPFARVSPWGFAGTASDGRSLMSLLAQPFIQSLNAISIGAPAPMALEFGAIALDRIATTQIQDAGRTSEAVAIAATPDITGYLRFVEPGACGRCVILAGRFYKWNDGFDRHPKCRCSHRPLSRESEPQTPLELFNAMSAADQARAFTKAGAEAIRLGADPALVINARRGMSKAANGRLTRQQVMGQRVFTTTEGTTKRGLAFQRLGGKLVKGRDSRYRRTNVTRLMPESILEVATSREDAMRLLRLHAYIL
jgi:hypothetical protein